MTTIHPETQIVASAYDKLTRICSYTYEHSDGSRYTVKIPIDELQKRGNTSIPRDQRRRHLAVKVANHIQTSKPDGI